MPSIGSWIDKVRNEAIGLTDDPSVQGLRKLLNIIAKFDPKVEKYKDILHEIEDEEIGYIASETYQYADILYNDPTLYNAKIFVRQFVRLLKG